jgi:hypothetical protein
MSDSDQRWEALAARYLKLLAKADMREYRRRNSSVAVLEEEGETRNSAHVPGLGFVMLRDQEETE